LPSEAVGTLSVVKTDERRQARELRATGLSVREVASLVGVAQSSASKWVRDVVLTPDQRRALDDRGERGRAISRAQKAERARAVRRSYQDEGRCLAHERGDSYAAGCMLYWAEGAKRRNTLKVTNSDPELLAYFADFLRRELNVPSTRMRLHCNLFADHLERQQAIEDYWLDRLGLPRTCLRKSVVNVFSRSSKRTRIGKLPYGTSALVVHSTRIVQTIYGSIQEYGGFERPEWLD
jgi:transcriptional regulator with XRE-family HTH domain